MIGSTPVHQYRLSSTPTQVTYSLDFELERARLEYGLTKMEFESLPGTREWVTEDQPLCKCDVLAVYRINQLLPVVFADMAQRRARMMEQG